MSPKIDKLEKLKCFIRLDGDECKNRSAAGWYGWREHTSYPECDASKCNDKSQTGCNNIKDRWTEYCGGESQSRFEEKHPNTQPLIDPAINSLDNLKQLYKDSMKKHDTLEASIDDYYKKTNTNERKVYYEIEELSNLKYYNNLLKIVYFVILGVYILVGPFRSKKQYKSIPIMIAIILYIIFPFIIKNITRGIFDYIFNNNSSSYNDQASCVNITNVEQAPKCYIKLDNGKCKNKSDLEWSGWRSENEFSGCPQCSDKNITGCNSLESMWGSYCGNTVWSRFQVGAPSDYEGKQLQTNLNDARYAEELATQKCYVRLAGNKCKDRDGAGWTGWSEQTSYPDCDNCNDNTQSGCDNIKNRWSEFCGGGGAFNIFSAGAAPKDTTCESL